MPYRIVSAPAGVFIDVFRTTPPLVKLYWFFFALPILLGIRIDPFEAAILTFSLQSSSFFAEVIRGGILSIERGQWEAGRGLGMTYSAVMRRVVLPQAFKRMIPPLLNRMIELMKTTTLVAAIAYADLLYQANSISQSTYRPLEVYSAAAAIYFVTLFALSLAVRGLEWRLAVTGESGRLGSVKEYPNRSFIEN